LFAHTYLGRSVVIGRLSVLIATSLPAEQQLGRNNWSRLSRYNDRNQSTFLQHEQIEYGATR